MFTESDFLKWAKNISRLPSQAGAGRSKHSLSARQAMEKLRMALISK